MILIDFFLFLVFPPKILREICIVQPQAISRQVLMGQECMNLLERHCNPWSVIKGQELRLSCDKFVCNLKLEYYLHSFLGGKLALLLIGCINIQLPSQHTILGYYFIEFIKEVEEK